MKTKSLNEKLVKIKLLVMDVDGTLTDSAMYYSERGEELKRFSTRDGMAITLLHKNSIDTAILTSESSKIAVARAEKLKIKHIVTGSRNKTQAIEDLSKKLSLKIENIAYIGDDVNDAHAMRLVGYSACPSDAVEQIQDIADHICSKTGGNGAVREFAELILKSQNKSVLLKENW